jgi:hypothetical protein
MDAPVGLVAAIAPDRPSAYIAGDRRAALAAGLTLPERVRGAALFADISGFTPLTEALAEELGSQPASEILTGHLNRVFGQASIGSVRARAPSDSARLRCAIPGIACETRCDGSACR